MSAKEVIIIGYSGHAFVVAEAALLSGFELKGYTAIEKAELNPYKLDYFGREISPNFSGWKSSFAFILGIGDNQNRKKAAEHILSNGGDILNVIHPTSSISEGVSLGIGNFISKNAAINPMASIGDFCIINTGAIVEHECKIGNGVHIAPGAVLAGNVSVGDGTFIGANAVVKQGVRIGENVIIGAGTVVLNHIEDNRKVVGNPAREI